MISVQEIFRVVAFTLSTFLDSLTKGMFNNAQVIDVCAKNNILYLCSDGK